MANTNLHGEDLIRHCGLNDEGKAVEQMPPQDFHRFLGMFFISLVCIVYYEMNNILTSL